MRAGTSKPMETPTMAGVAKSWHYPRPRLALQYYQTLFDVGLILSLIHI